MLLPGSLWSGWGESNSRTPAHEAVVALFSWVGSVPLRTSVRHAVRLRPGLFRLVSRGSAVRRSSDARGVVRSGRSCCRSGGSTGVATFVATSRRCGRWARRGALVEYPCALGIEVVDRGRVGAAHAGAASRGFRGEHRARPRRRAAGIVGAHSSSRGAVLGFPSPW